MGKLLDQLGQHLPPDEILRDFIREVEALSGLADWETPAFAATHWPLIVRWGHALWMTRTIAGVERVRQKLGEEIAAENQPRQDTFAELSAAALCVALGAVMAGRIPECDSPSADWRMVWPEDAEVDVEATIAQKKDAHVRRAEAAEKLIEALYDPQRRFDLVVDILDSTNQADCDEIIEASNGILSGEIAAKPGSYEVRAEPITRETTVLYFGGQDPAPAWWPNDQARLYRFFQAVAGPESTTAPPQVRVWTGLPFVSYVNPVMRKADSPQGTGGLPS